MNTKQLLDDTRAVQGRRSEIVTRQRQALIGGDGGDGWSSI